MNYKIIYNSKKRWAKELSKEVDLFLKQHKHHRKKPADFTVVIGGDGTIFYHKNKIEGRLIAIGSEKSYVCQLSPSTWERHILELITTHKVAHLPLINVNIGKKKIGNAINDVYLHSNDHTTISVGVSYKDYFFYFEGDGLVVSTPLGSTGYAFSSGGPKVSLDAEVLVLSPIAPVKRSAFPTVIPLTSLKLTYSNGSADLIMDGQRVVPVKEEQVISLSIGKRKIIFPYV